MKKTLKTVVGACVLWGSALAALPAQAADVSFMSFMLAEDAGKADVQKMMDDFHASSGLSVEGQGYAWGDMQKNIMLRARTNTLPDTAQISERWLPVFAAQPRIVDFGAVFGKERLAKLLTPEALRMSQVNGRQLGIPLVTGSIGLIANKEVLAKAGVAKMPQTMDEFRAALLAVRDKVPNSVPYAMATKNNNSIILDYLVWVWAFGGHLIADDGAVKADAGAGREALVFMKALMKDRLAAPDIDRPDSRRLFAQGASAFYFDAPRARTYLRNFSGRGTAFDAGMQPVKTPVKKLGDTPHSIEWGDIIIAFAPNGKLAADAPVAKWVDFLLSDAVQPSYALAENSLPVTQAARASDAVKKDAYLSAWSEATSEPLHNEIGIWSNAADLTNIVGEEVQAALLDQKTPDAAIASMQKRLVAAMTSLKKN